MEDKILEEVLDSKSFVKETKITALDQIQKLNFDKRTLVKLYIYA